MLKKLETQCGRFPTKMHTSPNILTPVYGWHYARQVTLIIVSIYIPVCFVVQFAANRRTYISHGIR